MEINKDNKIYSKVETGFGWRRNLNYFKENIILSFKTIKEYKINFYSMLLFDIILLISTMLSFTIIDSLTNEFLDWNIGDFFLFFCFNLLMWKFLWLHNLKNFGSRLIIGELNIYLVKPINTYFQVASKRISTQNLISGFILFLITIIFILYKGIYTNYFYAFLNLILGSIYFILFFNFFQSFYFFMKRNDLFLIAQISDLVTKRFTPKVFDNLEISYIFYLTPVAISSYFTIEILKNRFNEYLFYFPFIISTSIFFGVGIYILWKIGLKKYEAFG